MARMTRLKDARVFAEQCETARSFKGRFLGLMGRDFLPQGHGLLLEPCNSIHTFFMRFAIDVVYLAKREASESGRTYEVLTVRRDMSPWRADFPVFGAKAVLELPSGAAVDLARGDVLCLS